MTTPETIGAPLSSEWTMDVPPREGSDLARARLSERGYRLAEPVEQDGDGNCRVMMSHERTLGARQRNQGKLMLVAAVALTLVLLVMMARDTGGNREIVSGLLLVAVLLGGIGLNRLRVPLRHERRTMTVTVSPATDGGCRVVAKGETSSDSTAITDEPPTKAQVAAAEAALAEDMRAVEGRSSATEDAP
jgi:hypothetical protein